MSACFKKWYPTTHVVDCTEFFVNTPSSLARQTATNHNTVKCLLGIAPHGQVTFISRVFEGSISDRAIMERSGLVELLKHRDSVIANKGFSIQDLLIVHSVHLNVPPFKQGEKQVSPAYLTTTKKIAAVRIHIY